MDDVIVDPFHDMTKPNRIIVGARGHRKTLRFGSPCATCTYAVLSDEIGAGHRDTRGEKRIAGE